MTAVLASTGVSPAVSLPVTIMYRVVNTLDPTSTRLLSVSTELETEQASTRKCPMQADVTSLELGVSEFVGLLNQTLDFAYPTW